MATSTTAILELGVVYNLLLRFPPASGEPALIAALDRFAIEALHVVLRLYMLADLLFAPRRRGLPWWCLAVIVGYPLTWTVCTMLRGELVSAPDGSTRLVVPVPDSRPARARWPGIRAGLRRRDHGRVRGGGCHRHRDRSVAGSARTAWERVRDGCRGRGASHDSTTAVDQVVAPGDHGGVIPRQEGDERSRRVRDHSGHAQPLHHDPRNHPKV